MKKIITYEITSEEIEFIKNAPVDPCRKCYDSRSGACGDALCIVNTRKR